jgi:hypothetical protein
MRTTVDMDEDGLFAAKELAAAGGKTMGQVLSELVRTALAPKHAMKVRNREAGIDRRPRSAR